jgi:hypothetical protein
MFLILKQRFSQILRAVAVEVAVAVAIECVKDH